MRITKRQRAQVVELLRLATDAEDDSCRGAPLGLCNAEWYLGGEIDNAIYDAALRAKNAASVVGLYDDADEDYRHACLEAAARIEEGRWP